MDRARIEKDVCEIIGTVLHESGPVPGSLHRRHAPKWDSLKHVEIVFGLEDHFQVRFSEEDLEAMEDVGGIVSRLEHLLGS